MGVTDTLHLGTLRNRVRPGPWPRVSWVRGFQSQEELRVHIITLTPKHPGLAQRWEQEHDPHGLLPLWGHLCQGEGSCPRSSSRLSAEGHLGVQ